ncbi:MAG: hypothetical protein HQM08_13795 [Candidatus Riflebacteria bacterium]|nr:hypothetical protein [Candidatus Riflebacteria bacterium]
MRHLAKKVWALKVFALLNIFLYFFINATQSSESVNFRKIRPSIFPSSIPSIIKPSSKYRFGDLDVEPYPPLPGISRHGYVEIEFYAKNNSPTSSHEVKFFFPGKSYSSYSKNAAYINLIEKSIYLAPLAEQKVSLFQPALPVTGNYAGIEIDGIIQSETIQFNPIERENISWTTYNPCVLVSPLIGREEMNIFKFDDKRSYRKDLGGLIRPGIPPSGWPTNWLAFSRYDGIFLSAEELSESPPEVSQALDQYVQTGGNIVIFGKYNFPNGNSPLPENFFIQTSENFSSPEAGNGEDPELHRYFSGFGKYFVLNSTSPKGIPEYILKKIETEIDETKKLWEPDITTPGNQIFPIKGIVGIPVQGLFTVIFIYAMIIGPINLAFLSKIKRRIYVLWTVPLISLLTCIFVFFYATFSEGWSPKGHTFIFTFLDENKKLAASFGWMGLYTPLSNSDGLHFDHLTEITPHLLQEGFGRNLIGGPCSIDWTRDQHLTGSWLIARLPAHFKVRKIETRRERLTIRKTEENEITVCNGLGSPIKSIFLVDEKKRFFQGSAIAEGAEGVLKRDGYVTPATNNLLNSLMKTDWLHINERFIKFPKFNNWENSYVALLDGAPFIETGLPNFPENERENLVFGLIKTQEN